MAIIKERKLLEAIGNCKEGNLLAVVAQLGEHSEVTRQFLIIDKKDAQRVQDALDQAGIQIGQFFVTLKDFE